VGNLSELFVIPLILVDDGEARIVRVRLSNSHPRRAHGELPRASVAARFKFLRNASEQSKNLRQLRVPSCSRKAGSACVAIGQQSYGPAGEIPCEFLEFPLQTHLLSFQEVMVEPGLVMIFAHGIE
jgi:hypothetical protein